MADRTTGGRKGAMTDGELLARYARERSPEAFAELVRRHTDGVYGACLRILGKPQDAEDAVQAAFLVLMRKAPGLSPNVVLGDWLFWTATHCALRLKIALERRTRHEGEAGMARGREVQSPESASWEGAQPFLDLALTALPAREREVVVLRYFYSRTEAEIAREVGCPRSTVSMRLARALERLRGRLSRQGAALSAGALAAGLGQGLAVKAPAGLVASVQAVCLGQAAASLSVAALTKGVAKMMFWMKVKVVAAVVSAAMIVGGGGVVAVRHLAAAAGEPAGAEAGWPQWRGPNWDGTVPNSPKLLDRWPANGPKLVWKNDIGRIETSWNGGGGMCGPTVADGKVFLYVSWRRPAGGGDKYRPFTAQIMRDWGYIDDMPPELAKKIEEARLKTPKFNAGYHDVDYWMPEKRQDEGAVRLLKANPDLDKYTKDFLATLDPKDAEKYGSYVKRRFCNRDTGCGGPLTWEQVAKANAALRDKESPTFKLGLGVTQENFKFDIPLAATGSAWDQASKTTDTMICLDAATGKEIWKKEFPAPSNWSGDGLFGILGPASTPAVWGGKLYVAGVDGLYCLSAKEGALLWQVKGGPSHSSPLVADGVAVYPAGPALT
jgi:RNA polymerase sigma factor (sigma-70 family)